MVCSGAPVLQKVGTFGKKVGSVTYGPVLETVQYVPASGIWVCNDPPDATAITSTNLSNENRVPSYYPELSSKDDPEKGR